MEKIKIIAIDFCLRFVDRLRAQGDAQSLSGNILYSFPEIIIDTEQDDQQKYHTLWHEIFHGIADQMGIDLEENEINQLVTGYVQVLRDNKDLLEKYYPKVWRLEE